jgi:hypothetical protein
MGINLTNFFHLPIGKGFARELRIFVYLAMESVKKEGTIVRTKKAVISYDHKGILKVVLSDFDEIGLEDVVEQRKILTELTKGDPHVLLAIAGRRTSATREAREYSSANIPEGRLAEAILIKSLPVRLLGKFYININKPVVPTRMFDNEAEALTWLKQRLLEAGID